MSFPRLVYYSAIVGGWGAFLGWLLSEKLFVGSSSDLSWFGTVMMGGLVGAAIGAALNAVAGLASSQVKQILVRSGPGAVTGLIGGCLGVVLGDFLFRMGLPRVIGFIFLGVSVGAVEGLYERSSSKIRNGLIGGCLGGLLGGILFDVLLGLNLGSGMASRATAFVMLGLCVGLLIGLTQVLLKRSWLTVVDGYGVGRQLIISKPLTILGRGDHLPMPFMGLSNQQVEREHAKIVLRSDGRYAISDLGGALGTYINQTRLSGERLLADGDIIKVGTNLVRFSERRARKEDEAAPAAQPLKASPPPPPPPAVRPTGRAPAAVPTADPHADKPTSVPVSKEVAARSSPPPPPPPPPRAAVAPSAPSPATAAPNASAGKRPPPPPPPIRKKP